MTTRKRVRISLYILLGLSIVMVISYPKIKPLLSGNNSSPGTVNPVR